MPIIGVLPDSKWSSHPRLEDRIRNLEKEIKRAKRKKDHVPGRVPDPVDYYCDIALRVVDVEYEGRGKKYSAEIAVSSV